MMLVDVQQITVDFPIYNASRRSMKRHVFRIATGGDLTSAQDGTTVVRALTDVSIQMDTGDRVGIIGHNGSGKSTLLRVLSGVYEPTYGSATIRGSISSLIDVSLGLDPEATGVDNLYLRGALLGMTRDEVESLIPELIEFSELGDFIHLPMRTYSSGMHLRLAFAISTVPRADLLIMDEWLSVGDESFQKKAGVRLTNLIEQTKVLVLASHSRALLERTCNRIMWLEHGRVRMIGTPDEVLPEYFGPQPAH